MNKRRVSLLVAFAGIVAVLAAVQLFRQAADSSLEGGAVEPLAQGGPSGRSGEFDVSSPASLAPANGEPSEPSEPVDDPRESIEELWWPQPPEVTAALISQIFSARASGVVTLSPVICANTTCTVELTVTKELSLARKILANEPPFEVRIPGVANILIERTDESFDMESFTVQFKSYAAQAFGKTEFSEDDLLSLQSFSLVPCRDRGSPPTILGTYRNFDVIQQCICTFDCPNDLQQVFSIGLPAGADCARAGGIERVILSETDFGVREVNICTPSGLVP